MVMDPEVQANQDNTAADGLPYGTDNTASSPLPYTTDNTATSDEKEAGYSYSLKGDTKYAKVRRGFIAAGAGTLFAVSAVTILQGGGFDNPFVGTLPTATLSSISKKEGEVVASLSFIQQNGYEMKVTLSSRKVNESHTEVNDWYLYRQKVSSNGSFTLDIPLKEEYRDDKLTFKVSVDNGIDYTRDLLSHSFRFEDLPEYEEPASSEPTSKGSINR